MIIFHIRLPLYLYKRFSSTYELKEFSEYDNIIIIKQCKAV